ncbi:hypothetical protein ACO2RV_22070, partial [Ancylobacter sp. VNQ12]
YCPLAVQECAYEDGAMHGFDWGDLRFFLTVARAGRLTLAARQSEIFFTRAIVGVDKVFCAPLAS